MMPQRGELRPNLATLGKIYDRIHSAMMARVVPTGPQRAYADHVAIFAAVRAGDPDAAETAARTHVMRVLDELSTLDAAEGQREEDKTAV